MLSIVFKSVLPSADLVEGGHLVRMTLSFPGWKKREMSASVHNSSEKTKNLGGETLRERPQLIPHTLSC